MADLPVGCSVSLLDDVVCCLLVFGIVILLLICWVWISFCGGRLLLVGCYEFNSWCYYRCFRFGYVRGGCLG